MTNSQCSELPLSNPVPGFEDIHSDEPYIEAEISGEVAFVHMLYVPPHLRGDGVGARVVRDWLSTLDSTVKRVKLKACTLGGSDGVRFWSGLGFVMAYSGECYEEIENTMVIAVNGYSAPVPEVIQKGDDERHWLDKDVEHYIRHPQFLIGNK